MSTRREETALVDGLRGPMLAKLRKNSHKSPWREDDLDALLEKLSMEVDELHDAVRSSRRADVEMMGHSDFDRIMGLHRAGIIEECADVANFAAMIADLTAQEKP